MVDYFTIALTHGLLALAAIRLIMRDDLDIDPIDIAEGADPEGAPPHA